MDSGGMKVHTPCPDLRQDTQCTAFQLLAVSRLCSMQQGKAFHLRYALCACLLGHNVPTRLVGTALCDLPLPQMF